MWEAGSTIEAAAEVGCHHFRITIYLHFAYPDPPQEATRVARAGPPGVSIDTFLLLLLSYCLVYFHHS